MEVELELELQLVLDLYPGAELWAGWAGSESGVRIVE